MTVGAGTALATIVRRARERAGLSQRALALRMGVSQVTVSEVEKGRDPRRSTLLQLLEALPELDVESLFPGLLPRAVVRPSPAVWEFQRELAGYAAESVTWTISFGTEGAVTASLAVTGICSSRSSLRDDLWRERVMRAFCRADSKTIRALEASPGNLSHGKLFLVDGTGSHRFHFPPEIDEDGMSYEVECASGALPRGLRIATDRSGGAHVSVEVQQPIRHLLVDVRVKRSAWPASATWFVLPASLPVEAMDAHGATPLEPHPSLVFDARQRSMRLDVEWALPGLQYGLSWQWP